MLGPAPAQRPAVMSSPGLSPAPGISLPAPPGLQPRFSSPRAAPSDPPLPGGRGGWGGGPRAAPLRLPSAALCICAWEIPTRRFMSAADKYCIARELGGAGAPRHRPRPRARAGEGRGGGGGATGAAPAARGSRGKGGGWSPANAARSRSGAPPGSTQHPASLKFHRQRSAKVYL